MDYEAVYLPKNDFVKQESMQNDAYLELSFPFEKLNVIKNGIESQWSVYDDRKMQTLTLAFSDSPWQ